MLIPGRHQLIGWSSGLRGEYNSGFLFRFTPCLTPDLLALTGLEEGNKESLSARIDGTKETEEPDGSTLSSTGLMISVETALPLRT